MQEQRSGHFLVDVIYNNLLHLIYLKQNGSLGKYESAENKFLMKEAIDPDGFWVGGDIDVLVTGFNSRMISRPNVPTTYDGFLDGRLKGQMAINTNNPYALVGMVSLRGEEQGVAYIRKLTQQSLRPVQGFTHMVNLLAAGEYPIALMSQVTKIEEMKEKGAPVDWVSNTPNFSTVGAYAIAAPRLILSQRGYLSTLCYPSKGRKFSGVRRSFRCAVVCQPSPKVSTDCWRAAISNPSRMRAVWRNRSSF